jgi:hypothetical protein
MRAFASAWSHVDAATDARRSLARCWTELCDRDPFSSTVFPLSEEKGRLDVLVDWPPDLARQADDAATLFAASIKAAFDDALLTAATATTSAIETPNTDDYRMPLCDNRFEFLKQLDNGMLVGLRPDQVQTVWSLQPFVLADRQDHPTMRRIGRALVHLAGLLAPQPDGRSRVAVWGHSSEPMFEAMCAGVSSWVLSSVPIMGLGLAQEVDHSQGLRSKPVAEVDDATAKSVLLEENEIDARVDRQCGVAPAEDDRPDEQGHLVDQPGGERLRCEVRAAD